MSFAKWSLLPLIVTMSIGSQVPTPATEPAGVLQLSWIAGAWAEERGDGTTVEEYWSPPRAGMMLGAGRTIKGDHTFFFEHLRIEESHDGGVTYFAMPKGRPATPFKAIEISATRVVFENPEHDFPTRIIYERAGEDGLDARVEGKRGDKMVGESWSFKRMSMPRE